MSAEIAHADTVGKIPMDQLHGRFGQHDLPSMGSLGDPSRQMDVDADIVVFPPALRRRCAYPS